MRMTTEEAFVKVLQMHGIDTAFGIIGSAMMPITWAKLVKSCAKPRLRGVSK